MFGTYQLKGKTEPSVTNAIKQGLKAIDTASVYKNEAAIGRSIMALRKSGYDLHRNDIFIQTKIFRTEWSREQVCNSISLSLKKLNALDQMHFFEDIDVYLMHWPGPGRKQGFAPVYYDGVGEKKLREDVENVPKIPENWTSADRLACYGYMVEEMVRKKRLRAIGVCNFSCNLLRQLIQHCQQKEWPLPKVVQNEFHPKLYNRSLLDLCKEYNIHFQAYCSLGGQEDTLNLLQSDTIQSIAKKYEQDSSLILFKWAVQHGAKIIIRTSKNERIHSLLNNLYKFEISEEDMREIDSLDESDHGNKFNTMAAWTNERDPDYYL